MAIVEKRVCDVYGTTKDVRTIKVAIGTPSCEQAEHVFAADLSPRAEKRLLAFVKRGLAKAGKKLESGGG